MFHKGASIFFPYVGLKKGWVMKVTMEEVSKRYNVPIKILKEYESWGLCSAVKKVIGAWQYDDRDLERLGMIMTLHDFGFSRNEVETYMRLELEGADTKPQRLAMLKKQRNTTLDEIHLKEKQIAHMVYLRYEMENGNKK